MKKQGDLKAEHRAPIIGSCYIPSKLLDGTDCTILCDTSASKSFTSKTFYLNCPSLYSLLSLCQRQRLF